MGKVTKGHGAHSGTGIKEDTNWPGAHASLSKKDTNWHGAHLDLGIKKEDTNWPGSHAKLDLTSSFKPIDKENLSKLMGIVRSKKSLNEKQILIKEDIDDFSKVIIKIVEQLKDE